MAKKVALLGSTGSIGRQALEVIRARGYTVAALSAHQNADLLAQQVAEFAPPVVAITNEEAAARLRTALSGLSRPPRILSGSAAARLAVAESNADIVLNAIVGIAGLDATLTALAAGTDVALANKESLVAGGYLVAAEMSAKGAALLPVDSEHSAIFQCLQDEYSAKALEKIYLTASGGPFFGYTEAKLRKVKKAQALRHPNWQMGEKITIDSATMMNKGLELIEAMWLFGLPPEKIDILIQRESIIHSMVEFSDRSILAQLGSADMRIPIQYALTWPKRAPGIATPLDFSKIASLTFAQPDDETFRCLAACRQAAAKGGLAPCAANGANEEAVALFLAERISFLDIGRLVEGCVNSDSYDGGYELEDVYDCDAQARQYVREHM